MNKQKILCAMMFLLLAGFARGEGKNFKINGSVPELTEGEMLLLANRVGRVDTLGRGTIVDGKFKIEGELSEPCVAMIKVANRDGGFMFLLDTDVPYEIELWQSGRKNIKGGKLQGTMDVYEEIVSKANQKIKKLNEELKEASDLKHFKTVGELKGKLENVREQARKDLNELVEKNKDNLFAAYIQTVGVDQTNLEQLKRCYEGLSEKVRQMEPGKLVAARIAMLENVVVNAEAPNFTLTTPDGKAVALHDVKGKLKLVDFWASWCGPCRMENPNMVKLYAEFKDKGLVVVSVSLDEKKDAWLEAIQKDGLTWMHLSDLKGWKGEVIRQYNIDAVPTIFVLDENNRIVAKNLRGEKLRAFVADRLK